MGSDRPASDRFVGDVESRFVTLTREDPQLVAWLLDLAAGYRDGAFSPTPTGPPETRAVPVGGSAGGPPADVIAHPVGVPCGACHKQAWQVINPKNTSLKVGQVIYQ